MNKYYYYYYRGTNNAFQTKTESPLAILYSTSTMEHHHFDQCVMILNTDSNNIFQVGGFGTLQLFLEQNNPKVFQIQTGAKNYYSDIMEVLCNSVLEDQG